MEIVAAPKWLPAGQIGLIFWSFLLVFQVFAEVTFINRYGEQRAYTPSDMNQVYPAHLYHPILEILRTFSVVLRFSAFAGVFVTSIFYVTDKVIIMNGLAALLNAVVQISMIMHERKAEMVEDSVENGSDPTWWFVLSLITPILTVPVLFLFRNQTGLILMDNKKVANQEANFIAPKEASKEASQTEQAVQPTELELASQPKEEKKEEVSEQARD